MVRHTAMGERLAGRQAEGVFAPQNLTFEWKRGCGRSYYDLY